jgi:hypothetical protein
MPLSGGTSLASKSASSWLRKYRVATPRRDAGGSCGW